MPDSPRRFLTLDEVAEELAVSRSQAYALIRRGDVPAIKVGGRGQWRVERTRLEEYIAHAYDDTKHWLDGHPGTGEGADDDAD